VKRRHPSKVRVFDLARAAGGHLPLMALRNAQFENAQRCDSQQQSQEEIDA